MQFITDSEYYEKTDHREDELSIFFGGKELHIAKDFKFGPYIHDFYGLQYCKRGSYILNVEGSPVEISEGMLFVMPPYTHCDKIFTAASTSTLYINLKGSELEHYFSLLGFSGKRIIFPYKVPESCVSLLEEIIENLSTHIEVTISEKNAPVIPTVISCGSSADAAARRMRRRGLFQLLLSELMSLCTDKSDESSKLSQQQEYIDRAIKYVETNYNFDINVDEVAKHVGLNRSYLYTLFNDSLGMSVQEFIIQTRMRAACALLRHPDISIKSIAASVRYDPISFSRVFKKTVGMSPTEYRAINAGVVEYGEKQNTHSS